MDLKSERGLVNQGEMTRGWRALSAALRVGDGVVGGQRGKSGRPIESQLGDSYSIDEV